MTPIADPTDLDHDARNSAAWDPDDYAQNSRVQYQAAQLVLKSLTLDGDEIVLDVGSGDGRITAEISRQLPAGRIIGVDSSEQMVAAAKKKFPKSEYPNLDFEVQDAQKLPYNEQFDLVISFSVLHWLRDLDAGLKGIWDSLKAGGQFATTVVRGLYAPMEEATDDLIRSEKWAKYLAHYSAGFNFVQRDQYLYLLRRNSFRPGDVHDVSLNVLFDSRDTFKPWVKQWYAYTNGVPPEARDALLDDAVDRYLAKQPVDAKGDVFFVSRRLHLKATKRVKTR